MTALIPVHPSITEMSEEDRDRLYLDDAPRWVGPSAPSIKYVEHCRILVEAYAQHLADFVLDGDMTDEWLLEWRRRDYARARDTLRHVEAVQRRLYVPGAEGIAGWIVR